MKYQQNEIITARSLSRCSFTLNSWILEQHQVFQHTTRTSIQGRDFQSNIFDIS